MRTARRLVSLPFFPIAVSPFLLFAPNLLSGRALFWGTPSLQFVPWWSFAWDSLLNGQLPLWNPYVGMGAPLAANYQSALFYPSNWLYFLFFLVDGRAGIAWAQALVVALQLAFAGVGMAFLVRRLGLEALSQTVAGLAFCLSGYLVARAGFLSITSTAVWIPWLLLIGLRLAARDRYWLNAALLGVVLGFLLLAGHAQTAAYSLMLLLLWVTFWSWRTARKEQQKPGRPASSRIGTIAKGFGASWLGIGIAVLIGLGIAAVQLLPTFEYLSQSQRAQSVDFEFAMTYSFWPWRFLSLAAPDLFGSPAAGNYWGYGAFWEDAVYIGLLPLLLATRAIARALWPRNQAVGPGRDQSASIDQADLRALSIGLAVLVLLSFTLALGSNTPVFPWLYRNVPGFDMFQAPTRISIWAVTALAILASIGVQGWRAQDGRGLYWSRLGTAGAAAVMGAAALGWFLLDIEQNSFFLAMAKAGFWGFLFGILTLRAPQPEVRNPGGRWAWAVTLVLAADLLLAGWGLNPAVDLDFYRRPSQSAEAVAAGLGEGRLYLAPADEYDLKFNRLFTFSSFDPGEDWGNARAVLLPNLHMLDGILHTANFDPILPGRYVQWMDTLESAPGDTSSRLLNLSGVSVVEIADLDTEAGVRFDSQSDGTRFRWYTCALHAESGQDALDLLVDGDRRLEHLVVIEKPIEDEPADCGTSSAQIDLIVDESDQIILHLNTENDGWLLIADTWYPGWSAEVDGEPVEILRANFLFRAVEITEGAHEVEFVYRPQSFQWGLVITAVTVLCLAITAGFTAWRRETL